MKTRILGALESRKNTGGEWPIAKELARELGVSETTVRHHLKGLEQQHRVAVFASTLETSCTRVRLVEEAMT
jgi:predicted ArsR family transcriptional regulator